MDKERVLDLDSNSPSQETDDIAKQEAKKNSETSSEKRRVKIYTWLCGALVLTPLVLAILMLHALPTVFYTYERKTADVQKVYSS